MRLPRWIPLVVTLVAVATLPALADSPAEPVEAPPPEARSSQTRHSVRIGGETVDYLATVGWLILKDDDGRPIARFGYTAYTREGVDDPAKRPILFAFNGGPGSSSIWLHLGVLGPRRVVAADAGPSPPPPVALADNAESVLDVTDIVMIDPVGTGFSRPLGDKEGKDFWGVDQDIESVGHFVRRYVTENGRWASPRYILGESYGGIRSAGLVHHLQSRHGMQFNGVVLVSPFLDMGSGIDGAGIDLPHVLYLPTLAATAWYHELLENRPDSLEEFLAEVERFAYDEYAPALLAGYTISADRKREIAAKLARYTGTDPDWWMKADLRVTHGQFLQELQRDARVVTGRIDSRFVGPSINPLSESMDYDPFFPAVGPVFSSAFRHYLRAELDFETEDEYVTTNFGLDWDWKHERPGNRGWATPWADTVPDLAMALTTNPGLHVLVQQGWYDLATPHFAMKHDLSKLDVPPEARARIRVAYYEAGHMMYLHEASRVKFREELARFVRETDRLP